ncbi:MAG: hypothetical protein AAGL10_07890 [Pseudomonadota bacterium]
MRALSAACAISLALAAPSAALAQEAIPDASEAAISELSEKLADPEFQDQLSAIAQVVMSSMLDLEIGPIANAMSETTGADGPDIDPDARIRDIAPDAEEIPETVAEKLPQAMNSLSIMSEGMAEMLPALKAMAKRMRGAFEEVDEIE